MTTAVLKVLSTHAAMDVLGVLGPKFEQAHGCRLSYRYDPAKAVKRAIEDGTAVDIAIVTRAVFDDLVTQGKLLASPRGDVGRSGLGLSVRQDAAKPDISTAESFRHTLLAVRSVARSVEGTSGIYFGQLIDRLGIADQMRDKIVLAPSGRVAELVARGEAEIAVQQVPELLPVAGAQYVGPFPPELQLYSDFVAGLASGGKHRELAAAFVELLVTPEAAELFKATGIEPAAK